VIARPEQRQALADASPRHRQAARLGGERLRGRGAVADAMMNRVHGSDDDRVTRLLAQRVDAAKLPGLVGGEEWVAKQQLRSGAAPPPTVFPEEAEVREGVLVAPLLPARQPGALDAACRLGGGIAASGHPVARLQELQRAGG